MATVTAPIMTDATGQSIDSKLNSLLGKMDNLAAAFQPNASGIVYSNTTSGLTGDDVQEAIDEMAADVSEIKQSLSDLSDNRYYRKFVSTNFPTTSLSNGNYFYAIIDTGITTANYDLCSYVVWTNKWQMPMFLKIDTDRLSDTNYILRLNASKTDFPSYNDLSGSPITVLVVYKAKVS